MNQNLLSSKFITTMTGLVMMFVGFMVGKIDAPTFVPFVVATCGIYGATNVAAKYIDKSSAN